MYHLSQETLDNHLALYPGYKNVLEALMASNHLKPHFIDLQSDDVTGSMRKCIYNPSPWAILVSRHVIQEWKNILDTLPSVFKKCIVNSFINNPAFFSVVFEQSATVFDLFCGLQKQLNDHFLRLDLVYSNRQIKVIEVNAGSSIGGWQIHGLKKQYRSILSSSLAPNQRFDLTNPMMGFFRKLFECMEKHCSQLINYNVAILIDQTENYNDLITEQREIFKKVKSKNGLEGDLFFVYELDELHHGNDGLLYLHDKPIAAFLNSGGTFSSDPTWLTILHLTKKLFFPDNPMYQLFGSKTLFALAHEQKALGKLTYEEQAFIDKYIPFTVHCYKSSNALVEWNGREYILHELLDKNKENFVIKITNEFAGKNVYIGQYTPDHEWKEVMLKSFDDPLWIAQEYHQPDCLFAPSKNGSIIDYETSWGIFGFCGEYSGGIVRLNPKSNHEARGVINAGTGASLTSIFEEQ